ncbi:hypothetical protein B0H13DRAFT_2282679, partial [Mycena leptocephala]
MPDPISAATTLITLASFVEELLDLGQSIRRSIEKVRTNRRLICALADDIVRILAGFRELIIVEQGAFLAPQLLRALGISRRSHFKAWLRRDDVEMVIRNLKEHINKCYIQFTAFSAARTEYTALRVEQAIIVHQVENSVKLQRLEGMMAQLLLDTPFGNNVLHRTADTISSDLTLETLESKYLSAQTMRLVDFLHRFTATHNFRFEIPLWDPAVPMKIRFIQSTSAIHVLQTVLGMVLDIQDDFAAEDIADDLVSLGSYLSMLGMHAEAGASDVLTVHFLRCLASSEDLAAVLPRLTFSLCNLSKRYRHELRHNLALQASQQAVSLCGVLSGLAPDVDNSAVFLSALIGQSHDLCTAGQLLDAISSAEQAVVICRPILEQIMFLYPFNTGRQEISADDEWRAVKCCEAFFALARALSLTGNYTAAHGALTEGLHTVIGFAGSISSPSERNINMIFNHLCRTASAGALSLSILTDVIILYRDLSRIYRREFTLRFLAVLYAHAHLCDPENSPHTGAPPLHIYLESASDPVSRCATFGEISVLADNCIRTGVMEDAIRTVYASTCLPEAVFPVSSLIRHLFENHFDLTHAVLRSVVKSLISNPDTAPNIVSFAVAKISDTLSTSLPQQMIPRHQLILLDNLADLVTYMRAIARISKKNEDFYLYALWWYCWGLWLPGRLSEALAITQEATGFIRSSAT